MTAVQPLEKTGGPASNPWKTYPAYKPSGVEWLGDVPEHWDVKRCREVFRERKEFSSHGEEQLLSVSEYYGVKPRADVIDDGDFLTRADSLEGYRKCFANDLVMNYMLAWKSGLGVTTYDGIVSPAYAVFRFTRTEDHPRYFHHLLRTADAATEFKRFSSGIIDSRLRLYPGTFLGAIVVTLPPEPEQRAIASFLDRETGKIDRLVAKKRELIEKLKEERAALISRAVTRGLNPDAKFKSSGVEWLRDVPKHWRVKALKWETPVLRGASPRPIDDPVYFDDEGEYAWVRISDVTTAGMYLTKTEQRLSPFGSSLSVKMSPGALFLSIAGSVGKPCITKIKCCIHDGFVYFPRFKGEPRFLYYIFASGEPYKGLGKMGTQLNLNTDTVGSIVVGFPDADEQRAIADHLDRETGKIDGLAGKVEAAIGRLQEYRGALITAAVTGKIDVRGVAA